MCLLDINTQQQLGQYLNVGGDDAVVGYVRGGHWCADSAGK